MSPDEAAFGFACEGIVSSRIEKIVTSWQSDPAWVHDVVVGHPVEVDVASGSNVFSVEGAMSTQSFMVLDLGVALTISKFRLRSDGDYPAGLKFVQIESASAEEGPWQEHAQLVLKPKPVERPLLLEDEVAVDDCPGWQELWYESPTFDARAQFFRLAWLTDPSVEAKDASKAICIGDVQLQVVSDDEGEPYRNVERCAASSTPSRTTSRKRIMWDSAEVLSVQEFSWSREGRDAAVSAGQVLSERQAIPWWAELTGCTKCHANTVSTLQSTGSCSPSWPAADAVTSESSFPLGQSTAMSLPDHVEPKGHLVRMDSLTWARTLSHSPSSMSLPPVVLSDEPLSHEPTGISHEEQADFQPESLRMSSPTLRQRTVTTSPHDRHIHAFPAYADGDEVEYYSRTHNRWLRAVVNVRLTDQPLAAIYNVRVRGQSRRECGLDVLRRPLCRGELVELYEPNSETNWVAAVVCRSNNVGTWNEHKVRLVQSSRAEFSTSTNTSSKSTFFASVSSTNLRRRFPARSKVELYCGPRWGWLPGMVQDGEPSTGTGRESIALSEMFSPPTESTSIRCAVEIDWDHETEEELQGNTSGARRQIPYLKTMAARYADHHDGGRTPSPRGKLKADVRDSPDSSPRAGFGALALTHHSSSRQQLSDSRLDADVCEPWVMVPVLLDEDAKHTFVSQLEFVPSFLLRLCSESSETTHWEL
eukprot:gnl/TRDRNA2_/TRDRNA2_117381_c0_seq1.p1 gnl/TRDRNA2_/TRDRNA2_117381_c0~~gnl/TRDRNA2_/TRDRNA2_117381_c0_seq1.p1  ORF type:complete len:767 (+),score=89.15 gnl/TRDRNA2_/TRDRNA2_117381_c0_seq1:193-2301(+)